MLWLGPQGKGGGGVGRGSVEKLAAGSKRAQFGILFTQKVSTHHNVFTSGLQAVGSMH